jgi:hypothetical protein
VTDAIVEEVRRVREELIQSFGGINGYFQHCRSQDRAAAGRGKPRQRKQALALPRRRTKPKKNGGHENH